MLRRGGERHDESRTGAQRRRDCLVLASSQRAADCSGPGEVVHLDRAHVVDDQVVNHAMRLTPGRRVTRLGARQVDGKAAARRTEVCDEQAG